MADASGGPAPQSPETQPAAVREELDQRLVSHEGDARSEDSGEGGAGTHLGAVETEVTPNMPPVRGPDDLVGSERPDHSAVDPADEITPG